VIATRTRKETAMAKFTRRSMLHGSLALAATGVLARSYIANAAATTATVWWAQGFVEEEDVAFKKMVADYQKASGNTIDYSITSLRSVRRSSPR
jgi:multiple sugar transport system substrate-binding protein